VIRPADLTPNVASRRDHVTGIYVRGYMPVSKARLYVTRSMMQGQK